MFLWGVGGMLELLHCQKKKQEKNQVKQRRPKGLAELTDFALTGCLIHLVLFLSGQHDIVFVTYCILRYEKIKRMHSCTVCYSCTDTQLIIIFIVLGNLRVYPLQSSQLSHLTLLLSLSVSHMWERTGGEVCRKNSMFLVSQLCCLRVIYHF